MSNLIHFLSENNDNIQELYVTKIKKKIFKYLNNNKHMILKMVNNGDMKYVLGQSNIKIFNDMS